jgi:hypothetical protein
MECGLSYAELADKTGVTTKQIHRHISGGKKAYPSTLDRYAKALSMLLGQKITATESNSAIRLLY